MLVWIFVGGSFIVFRLGLLQRHESLHMVAAGAVSAGNQALCQLLPSSLEKAVLGCPTPRVVLSTVDLRFEKRERRARGC